MLTIDRLPAKTADCNAYLQQAMDDGGTTEKAKPEEMEEISSPKASHGEMIYTFYVRVQVHVLSLCFEQIEDLLHSALMSQ